MFGNGHGAHRTSSSGLERQTAFDRRGDRRAGWNAGPMDEAGGRRRGRAGRRRRGGRRQAGRGRAVRGRHRVPAGRRRVPVLGLRAEQDDDPGGQPAGRGPPGRRAWPGTRTVAPDWAPVARRIRDEATDTWDDTVAVDRFVGKGGRFVRGAGTLVGPGRVAVGDRTFQAVPRRSWSAPARRRRSRRSRASPARRTGPTTRRSRPTPCRSRWSCSAAARSGWSWPRCSPGSGSGSPWSRRSTGCSRPRSRSRPRWPQTALRADGVSVRTAHGGRAGRRTTNELHRLRRRAARRSPGRPCWSPPAGRADLGRSGWTRSGSTRPPGSSTVDERLRVGAGDLGRRRRHRQGRVHPRRHVPGRDRGGRHPRPGVAARPTTTRCRG